MNAEHYIASTGSYMLKVQGMTWAMVDGVATEEKLNEMVSKLNRKLPKKKATASPADPRWKPTIESWAYEYRLRNNEKYEFLARDFSALKSFFKDRPTLDQVTIQETIRIAHCHPTRLSNFQKTRMSTLFAFLGSFSEIRMAVKTTKDSKSRTLEETIELKEIQP